MASSVRGIPFSGDRQRPDVLDQGRQVAARDVLHDEEVDAPGLVGVVVGDDVRVPELGGGDHLALEAGDGRGVLERGRRQRLDRHDPLHPAVLRLEDLAHAPGADPVEDRVIAQDQRSRAAQVDLLDLEPGEVPAPDQVPGELLDVLRMGLGRDESLELPGGEEAAFGDPLD
jgi:hypothetical protein